MSKKKQKNEEKAISQAAKGLVKSSTRSEKSKKRGKKALKTEGVSRYLKAFNPYYLTLEDPFNVHGVKIPDATTYPSACFSITDRRTVTVSAAGCFGIMYGGTTVTASTGTLIPIGGYSWQVGQMSGAAAVTTDVMATNSSALTLANWNATTGFQVPALYTSVRLVSAGLAINPTGAWQTASGKMSGAVFPKGFINGQSGGLPITRVDSFPNAKVVPVNTGEGVTLTYTPQDPTCLSYVNFNATDNSSKFSCVTADVGTFAVVGDGLAAGSTVQCVFVANYEGLASTNALSFISASPSRSDPMALAVATNYKQDLPPVVAGTEQAEGVIQGDPSSMKHHEEIMATKPIPAVAKQDKTLFEKILDGVVPLAEKALPMLASLA